MKNREVTHMKILANISRKLIDENFRLLLNTQNKEEVFGILSEINEGKTENCRNYSLSNRYCTYLYGTRSIRKEMGHTCHIETQGSIGIENELTKKEIIEADVVILAVEVVVEGLDRFEDKVTVKENIARCISDQEAVINDALSKI